MAGVSPSAPPPKTAFFSKKSSGTSPFVRALAPLLTCLHAESAVHFLFRFVQKSKADELPINRQRWFLPIRLEQSKGLVRESVGLAMMWRLVEGVLEGSLQEISNDGVHGNEGVVLWLGRCIQGQAEITHLVGLRGSGVTKLPDLLVISSWVLNEVADVALQLSVSLIGQIHTHGSGYGIDLSKTDRTRGIAVPHFLSVVAPDYGLRSDIGIADCGVHVFEPGLGYRRLSTREVEQRVQVVPEPPPPLLLIGQD